MTGATPAAYSFFACSSRAWKIDDGTPLYCADPSTTIASECGRASCRAVHQMASAVATTISTTAIPAAHSTRRPSRPAHAPTRHGYHAPPTPGVCPGDGVPSARGAGTADLGAPLGDDGQLGRVHAAGVVPAHLHVPHRRAVDRRGAHPGDLRSARVQVLPGQLVGGDPGALVVADQPVRGRDVPGD